jgi:hypothetical protein
MSKTPTSAPPTNFLKTLTLPRVKLCPRQKLDFGHCCLCLPMSQMVCGEALFVVAKLKACVMEGI